MTPKHSPLTELIHAVLDGEASDAEARELEVRLAADPSARAEFEDWKRLFEALDAVPKEHAPEGLVASITSAMPEAPGAPDAASQPFPGRRVLGQTSFGISHPVPTRSFTMTEQSNRRTFASRKAWLGGGIAAAVAVVVAQIALDFPIPKDVVGTVVPAQRYRAAQNGSEQVQLGARADQAAPTSTVPEASRSLAEKSAAESALKVDNAQVDLKAEKAQVDLKVEKAQVDLKADRMQADKMQADKMQADRMQADRMQADRMQADRMQADRMQADRMQAEKMQVEKMQVEKMQADRMQAEKMQTQRMQADKMQVEKMQADKMQADKMQAEKMQAERTRMERTSQQ